MTDITELAQHMKAAAVLAKKYRSLTLTVSVEETLALVEALEYYKSREERVTSLVRDNSKSWDELYRQVEAKGKRNVELVEALEKAQQRIAELESRTVKLPEPEQWDITQVLLCKKKVVAAIRAAGIKVEAE